jgi:ADP-ribosyl-[dinitrogen reductase] hydrolase
MNSRFAGCLVGLACGDALGGPAEEIPGHPSKVVKPVTEMIGGGNFGLLLGQVTDDTEMALCLVRSLLEKQGFDPADIAHKFKEWFFDSPIGAGGTVRAAMERLRDGISWDEAGNSELGLKSLGNGSVMRCAPIALFDCFSGLNKQGNRLNETKLLEHTRLQGIITHPREECIHAANFINVIISYLLTAREPSKEELTKAMSSGIFLTHGPRAAVPYALYWIPPYMQEKYKDIAKRDQINPFGTVHNTVIASVNCLLTTYTFEDAVVKAVNLGGDADTIAAITGAMAGAWYGIEAIPERWSSKLVDRHGKPVLEELMTSSEALYQLALKA